MVCTVKRKCDGLNIVDANNYVYQLDRKCSDKKTYWLNGPSVAVWLILTNEIWTEMKLIPSRQKLDCLFFPSLLFPQEMTKKLYTELSSPYCTNLYLQYTSHSSLRLNSQ